MKACFNELYTHLLFSKTNERKEALYPFKFKITDLAHEVSDFCMPRVRNKIERLRDMPMPPL
jgi:hypothetical protein